MSERSTTRRVLALAAATLIVFAAGAGGMYLYLRGGGRAVSPQPPAPTPIATEPREIAMILSPEAVSRAGIHTARPTLGPIGASLAVPGVVEPNAYGQVVVRAVAGGQVRSVAVDLGARVKQGDLLATIYSPDLAEAQRMFFSMRSEFDAAHERLARLEALVKIGAASQEELEAAQAEHTRHAADVESARAKLALLGVSANRLAALGDSTPMDSTVRILAPRDGVITARSINQGVNIDASAELFTVVDLTVVWVVASIYERDLGRIQIGSAATITSSPLAGRTWTGRVSYIDPQLAPDTRTAKVRIEVKNSDRLLRLGMYTEVVLAASASANGILIPRTAVQTIGAQTVVYVADTQQRGRYLERSVALGTVGGTSVEVLKGISDANQVVVAGSFALRAERDRLGLPPPASVSPTTAALPGASSPSARQIEIAVTKEGFVPTTVNVSRDVPFDLVFIRRTDDTCAKEVVIPAVNVRKPLPLNQRVTIAFPPTPVQTLTFICGMNMLQGTVVIR